VGLSCERNGTCIGNHYSPPEPGSGQRYFSPPATNLRQESRRENPGEWRAEGVDWQEVDEDLRHDFIGQRQHWILVGIEPVLQ
jgi:hypothetical protein